VRLYVDFDDVLCQTARGLMDRVNKQFGKCIVFDEILSFDLEHSFALAAHELEWLLQMFHEPEVLLGFEPIDGAAEVLRAWATRGGAIDIVTGRPPATRKYSEQWLEAYAIPYDKVLFVDKYGRGFPDAPGAETLTMDEVADMAYSAAIDDSAEMMSFLSGRVGYPLILLDRPWNRALPRQAASCVRRLQDWDSVGIMLEAEINV
jgi:uncharacterized HAD superfamily protein